MYVECHTRLSILKVGGVCVRVMFFGAKAMDGRATVGTVASADHTCELTQ